MKGKYWGILAAVVVIGAAAWLMASHAGKGSTTQTTAVQQSAAVQWPPTPGRSAGPLTQQAAQQLSKDLAAGSEGSLGSAVALPTRQTLSPGALQQLQAMGPVIFDTSSFHDNHDGTATITARLAKPTAGSISTWTVQLIDVDSQWKISLTEPSP